jgi:hypothetical protein
VRGFQKSDERFLEGWSEEGQIIDLNCFIAEFQWKSYMTRSRIQVYLVVHNDAVAAGIENKDRDLPRLFSPCNTSKYLLSE